MQIKPASAGASAEQVALQVERSKQLTQDVVGSALVSQTAMASKMALLGLNPAHLGANLNVVV